MRTSDTDSRTLSPATPRERAALGSTDGPGGAPRRTAARRAGEPLGDAPAGNTPLRHPAASPHGLPLPAAPRAVACSAAR
ncbi:hypothetical protein [Streptomyces sp. NPDC088785]|uniref:hypothetical protein n=1 Tax=Streptomyces sp. NPDC088785 TaxID=3365897 RepID=UPI003816D64B